MGIFFSSSGFHHCMYVRSYCKSIRIFGQSGFDIRPDQLAVSM